MVATNFRNPFVLRTMAAAGVWFFWTGCILSLRDIGSASWQETPAATPLVPSSYKPKERNKTAHPFQYRRWFFFGKNMSTSDLKETGNTFCCYAKFSDM